MYVWLRGHVLVCPAGALHLAVDGYDGELLLLAQDLGTRMLSAFVGGCSKLPRTFVNLRGGNPRQKQHEQCTAGVGTLLLEMGVLSRSLHSI